MIGTVAQWKRLIRFRTEDGSEHFGEPQISDSEDVLAMLEMGLDAEILEGDNPFEVKSSGKVVKVKDILHLLQPNDVPTIGCFGLNYKAHIAEAGRKPPPYPSLFIKHSTTVAGWNEDVPIPKVAQDDQADYEGELSIVIGKTGKNISKEDAISYVAGYVASNDISSRKWQRDPAYAGIVPQWCFSKGFDKYAPVGPLMVSPSIVGTANNLRLRTLVNGEERQNTTTSDLLFDVPTIISFLSQGTTLERGTVIMTGTPSGVGMTMADGPMWLRHGDIVEVEVEHCGRTKNRIVYE
ncbi:hypothetical protein BCR34DRAFT_634215 [Clohesyomyces aquaticus]|uniref:Fumarylacetoacetase-like C-terminal domain-containing protein n=1 Tax=Clohesyomyces aquaticus TaxID=1231657 RepID=A0A1Y1Z268_9PLEO|nr:hypothetical protein BCR34DRAFT_634215 [Clohesyomyces aquaticus]